MTTKKVWLMDRQTDGQTNDALQATQKLTQICMICYHNLHFWPFRHYIYTNCRCFPYILIIYPPAMSQVSRMRTLWFTALQQKCGWTDKVITTGSICVILLCPKVGVAPTKDDVISMLTKQYTHIKYIAFERYHPLKWFTGVLHREVVMQ